MQPPVYRIRPWLSEAWRLCKGRFLALMALTLIESLVLWALWRVQKGIWSVHCPERGYHWDTLAQPNLSLAVCSQIAMFLYGGPIQVGLAALVLHYVRAGTLEWGRVWTGFRKWGHCALLAVWPGVLLMPPVALPILQIFVPITMAAAAWFGLSTYALAETGGRYRQAVSHGFRIVRLNFWGAVLFVLVQFALLIGGAFACGIGLWFTYTLVHVFGAVAYNDLIRQVPLDNPPASA